MEAVSGGGSPGGSAGGDRLGDPYDLAMAQMEAQMFADGDDLQSLLGAASGNSDEELRIIMGTDSQAGFAPVSAAPEAKVARSAVSGRRSSERSRGRTANTARPGEKEGRSRARSRKPHEPEPFLSIDTLPTDKLHRQTTPSCATPSRGETAIRRKQINVSSGHQTRAPPGSPSHPVFNTNRSRMGRRTSSAVSSEWNPLVPRTKPLSETVLENPVNFHVKVPFKHTINQPDMEKVARPMSPGQTMKERTMLATFYLARTMARLHGEEENRPTGRLLKGKLKPLYPVKVDGPSMAHCRGVVAEENSFMNSNSKTLERRRKIMAGMLNKDFLYERAPTAESLQHTSVASDLSEGREQDLDDQVMDRDKNPDLLTPPHDGIREPPNSLSSISDPNVIHNATSAGQFNSDAFEINKIQQKMTVDQIPNTIKEVSDAGNSMVQSESSKRPGTGKAVRFAEKTDTGDKDAGEGGEEEKKQSESSEGTGRCKPPSDHAARKYQDEDDPDPNGGKDQGKLPDGQSSRDQGQSNKADSQTQSDNQCDGDNQGQTEGYEESNEQRGDEEMERLSDTHTNLLRASYNTVLFTSEEVSFPRQGTVFPAKKKKTPKKTSKDKTSPQKSTENVNDFVVLGGGTESPTKDYYDKFARCQTSATGSHPRTQSARMSNNSKKKSLLLRRPISANVSLKEKQTNVQFIIKPTTAPDEIIVDEFPATSPRLNEIHCQIPLSARTKTSGVPTTARSAMEPTIPRRKVPEPAIEFKIEGSKMSQDIKAGVCTVCGKLTSKIAEYWEGTETLVCDVCDRRMRAEENKKIDWIRKQMHSVYRGDCNENGDPVVSRLMLTENGASQDEPMNNLDDLEKALNAVHSEINEAIHDIWDKVTIAELSSSEDEKEELISLVEGKDNKGYTQDHITHQKEGPTILDEEAGRLTNGEISKILTKIDVDPTTLTQYEMRVYWYKEYSQAMEKENAAAENNKSKMVKRSPEAEKRGSASGNVERGGAQTKGSSGVYDELRRAIGHQTDTGEINTYHLTMMADQQDTMSVPINELLQQNQPDSIVPKEKFQHFKGQRVSTVNPVASDSSDGKLGVSGTAKKLLRPLSAKKAPPVGIAPFAPLCFRINARPPPGYLYYFAYGADMNPDRMESYTQRPMAADRLWGLLYGFQLVFNKRGTDLEAGTFPNIELSPTSSVEGCLYLITLEELDMVDQHVGYPEHYDHAMLPVWLLNCSEPDEYGVAQYCVPALLLVTKDEWVHKGGATLSSEYAVEQCMKGGGNVLSPAYHQHLKALKT